VILSIAEVTPQGTHFNFHQYSTVRQQIETKRSQEKAMSTFDKPPKYKAYLLRFWEERSQQMALPPLWRFSLQDPHTGHRHGFPNLEALVAFLRVELNDAQEQEQDV
jgi:hypothetical protein